MAFFFARGFFASVFFFLTAVPGLFFLAPPAMAQPAVEPLISVVVYNLAKN